MSEENDLNKAVELLQSGRKKEAAAELSVLYKKASNDNYRVRVIDALISALDPVKENEQLIQSSADAINLTHRMNRRNMKAHFMARKADFLTNKISLLKYNQHNLKLSPDWIGFATESDKDEYEAITAEVGKLESETDSLLKEAVDLANKSGDKRTEGYVWMSCGQVNSTRYLHFKMDAMRGSSKRAKWWIKLAPLRRHGLENYLFFNFNQIKQLRGYIMDFTQAFLKAAKTFREADDVMEAYALFNLANNLNSAFVFRKARQYLEEARRVATKHNEHFLLRQIMEMEKIIEDRNKHIPNYLAGETRDFPKKVD